MDGLTLTFLHKPRRQRGELHLPAETAILSVILMTLLVAAVTLTQLGQGRNEISNAAHAAARDVSLLRSPRTAATTAQDAVRESLAASGTSCARLDVRVDASDLTAPLGQSGAVSITVTCRIALAPGIVDWIPTTVDISRTSTSPVDPYRERP